MLSQSNNGETKTGKRAGLKIGVVVAVVIALLLAAALVTALLLSTNNTTQLEQDHVAFDTTPAYEDAPSHEYRISLDVSAYHGAVVSEDSVSAPKGEQVASLPFATLDAMRFIGWFTGPEGDENALKIDNNSLELLTPDQDQTLYARFEARPTSTDYDNPGLPIMMYHYFYDPDLGESGQDANWMNINLFKEHLAYMQANNYYFPTWEEVVAYIRGEILLPVPSIVLCSDDGHESFFRLAAPLVLEYGAKMTSFIVLKDLPPDRLQEYDPTRIFVQSHSYDMHRGGRDGDARILTATYQEIYDDALMAEQLLGNTLVYCYPFGKTNDNARQALSDAGVGVALVIENSRAYPLCDPMAVPRLRLNSGASVEYLSSVAY